MIKVKAKRTFFVVNVYGENKQLTYDSQKKPTDCELLNYAYNLTGADKIKIVSRETIEILLTMPFETFYEFCSVEYDGN